MEVYPPSGGHDEVHSHRLSGVSGAALRAGSPQVAPERQPTQGSRDMKVHLTNLLQNHLNEKTDYAVYQEHLNMSLQAEGYCYDSVGCAQHHFDPGYAMCPDNVQFLTYLAAKTSTIKVQTTAVILPWNDPYRVAAKIALLDNLS